MVMPANKLTKTTARAQVPTKPPPQETPRSHKMAGEKNREVLQCCVVLQMQIQESWL